MSNQAIEVLKNTFDTCLNEDSGVEYWYARDLQKLLGYDKWDNFKEVIKKAKIACESSGNSVLDHFPDIGKMVDLGSGSKRSIDDIKLTRYACYLIAQNGDPRKEAIAFAQTYFAVQTRKMEIIEQRMAEYERLKSREKLTESEKLLSALAYERGVDDKGFGIIRSRGDQALFGITTKDMKNRLNIPDNKPLADYLPDVTIKAKDLANSMTNHTLKTTNIHGHTDISYEHVKNNTNVRKALTDSNIYPENLPAEEDIKKVERRVKKEEKLITKKSK
ncbi:MAG: DNA-damage-inducible protein D [Alphaproteobacteria bacterium ADurb.Bin438]|nr:MAG: DNA-damage-inducible protein D [Alphaproteobacteria bacterium ADurb.Bin438]